MTLPSAEPGLGGKQYSQVTSFDLIHSLVKHSSAFLMGSASLLSQLWIKQKKTLEKSLRFSPPNQSFCLPSNTSDHKTDDDEDDGNNEFQHS